MNSSGPQPRVDVFSGGLAAVTGAENPDGFLSGSWRAHSHSTQAGVGVARRVDSDARAALAMARPLAVEKGLPYQTYMKSLLHETLKEEEEPRAGKYLRRATAMSSKRKAANSSGKPIPRIDSRS